MARLSLAAGLLVLLVFASLHVQSTFILKMMHHLVEFLDLGLGF
jgi:xanthosine utilization system XapX-like protein